MGHNYMGHNYRGHNYRGHQRLPQRKEVSVTRPHVRICARARMQACMHRYAFEGELTEENLKVFVQAVLDGTQPPAYKSEKIPTARTCACAHACMQD